MQAYRIVEYKHVENQDTRSEKTETKIGYFHQWVNDSHNNSVYAIIEALDGTIILAEYSEIKFTLKESTPKLHNQPGDSILEN